MGLVGPGDCNTGLKFVTRDSVGADLILRLKAAGDLSIVMIMHNMIMHNYAQMMEIADRIVLMQRG